MEAEHGGKLKFKLALVILVPVISTKIFEAGPPRNPEVVQLESRPTRAARALAHSDVKIKDV